MQVKRIWVNLYTNLFFDYFMKHIGWCLDRILIVTNGMPRTVVSPEDIDTANNILDEVQKYADTMAQLVQYPKFKKSLNQLEKSSIEGVRLQAHEIEELFKDLEHALLVIDLYIKNLREIIRSTPEQWAVKSIALVHMIDQKFAGERGELRKEFQVALHKEEELKSIVTSEEHLAEFLKL